MKSGKSESEVQQLIQLLAPKYGCDLMRNNNGAGNFIDELTGNKSYVRFGLGNISKEQNKRIKSSDLIGLFKGRFIAVEVKKEGWVFNPKDEREQAQLAFINFVISKGGIAGFCASELDFLKLIGVV